MSLDDGFLTAVKAIIKIKLKSLLKKRPPFFLSQPPTRSSGSSIRKPISLQ